MEWNEQGVLGMKILLGVILTDAVVQMNPVFSYI